MSNINVVIIPHKHRTDERRAVWLKDEHKVRFELFSKGEWIADYTMWDSELQTPYFQSVYDYET